MKIPARYQSVIFIDLDGTLIVNPFEAAVWPQVLGEIARKSGQSLEAIYALIEAENDVRQQGDYFSPVLAMDWDDISQTVAWRLGVRLEANCENLVRQHAASQSSTLEYAHEALHELQASHRALVVATKGLAKYQQPVLEALELTPYFTAVLTPDTHNALKKHRHFFGDWSQQAQLVVMVGNRYDDDVLYPARHGFKTIWKPPQSLIPPSLYAEDPFTRAQMYLYADAQSAHATAIILSLRELPETVMRLEQTLT